MEPLVMVYCYLEMGLFYIEGEQKIAQVDRVRDQLLWSHYKILPIFYRHTGKTIGRGFLFPSKNGMGKFRATVDFPGSKEELGRLGWSIGGFAKSIGERQGVRIRKLVRAIEVSLTPHPCNPTAVLTLIQAKD